MEHRNGICASCGAKYKIPASFEHDRARCRECDGTVEIGPVVREDSDAPGGRLEEYVPSGKKRSGPSMREQLIARRRKEAGSAKEPAPAPAAKATPKRTPAKSAATEPARRAAPSRRGSTGRGRAAKPADSKSTDDGAGEGATPGGGAGRRSIAGRGRGGRAGRGRGGRGSRRGGGGGEKKKPPMGMIVGVGGLVLLLGVGGYLFRAELFGSDSPVDAADTPVATLHDETTGTEDAAAPDGTTATPDAAEKDGAAPAGETPDGKAPGAPMPKEPAPTAGSETAGAETPDGDAADGEADSPEFSGKYDPARIDLAAVEDFGPVDDTTEEFWEELKARMVRAMDPDLGRGQVKEWEFLKQHPRQAFPVILNYMKGLDYSTEDATEKGKWAQRILEDICNGTNFGWKEYQEDADKAGEHYFEWFNKTAVLGWCKAWAQAEDNLKAWKNLAKLSEADYKALLESRGEDPDEPSTLDLLDD